MKINWQLFRRLVNLIIILGVIIWSMEGMNINWERISRGIPSIGNIIRLMFPPDMGYFSRSLSAMMESIQIAVIGTTVAAILAFPISFLSAAKIGVPFWLVFIAKQVLNAIRTFPELILGIFFVASYGPGPLAGVMAIGINSIGMLGKLNSEIVETIDRGPIEALEASGSNRAEVFLYAIFPQVLPQFLATALYRFELNLRAATVLGLVGAGGIGVILLQALQFRRWPVVGMSLLIIIVVVTIIDYSSAYIRKRIT